MKAKMPKTLDMGAGELMEVSYLENILGVTRRTAFKYLEALRIQPLYIGKEAFFNLMTLKRILFVLSKPGGKGFVFPSSTKKNNARFVKNPNIPTQVPDEVVEEASKPEILAEMIGCSGRDNSIIKQFVTKKVGRPKEKNEV